MTGQESDQGPLLGTPDTCSLGDWPSPRTAARIGGDFAQLIPVNRPAMLAFDAIVKTLQLDPPVEPSCTKIHPLS